MRVLSFVGLVVDHSLLRSRKGTPRQSLAVLLHFLLLVPFTRSGHSRERVLRSRRGLLSSLSHRFHHRSRSGTLSLSGTR